MQGLIFDCDGVLADTERDGHRVAFNKAFAARGLGATWPVERYGELLTTAGGKERMGRHFQETGWPVPPAERARFLRALHRLKTDLFLELIEAGALPLHSGVARLVDEAIAAGVTLAVCSTASERAVSGVVAQLRERRAAQISIFAGDIVAAKKPDPAVYALACAELDVDPAHCVAIEDSAIGLQAALRAGLRCVVTPSAYTTDENFEGAALVVPELGDGADRRATLAELETLCG